MQSETMPKFLWVKDQIKEKIHTKEFVIGKALPTHAELGVLFDVSDITIRRAIKELVDEGLLISKQGKGVFVIDRKRQKENTSCIISVITMKPYDVLLKVPFYVNVLNGLTSSLSKSGKLLSIWQINNEAEFINIKQELLLSSCGFFILGHFPRKLLQLLARDNSEIVCIDNMAEGIEFDGIGIDNTFGAYKAVSYLLSKGHRKIGFINDKLDSDVSRARLDGYKLALEECGCSINNDLIRYSVADISSSASAAEDLYRKEKVSAIFAFDDTMAMGVVSFAERSGLRIPDDLAIIGFGNYQLSPSPGRSLSSISLDAKSIGINAADRILRRINGEVMPTLKILVSTSLIKGDTV